MAGERGQDGVPRVRARPHPAALAGRPMGLLVLGASVALVLTLVLLGLGATGWGL